MAEVAEESTHVWTHKARIVIFLSAMRHFRDSLLKRKVSVHYRQLDDRGNKGTFDAELEAAVKKLKPGPFDTCRTRRMASRANAFAKPRNN